MSYHEGEIAVQTRAHVVDLARKVGRIVGTDIPPGFAEFLRERRFVVTSTVAADGTVTASMLGGQPGFADAVDEETLRLRPSFGHLDAVRHDLGADPRLGILVIDFATRRRIRLNGQATDAGGTIVVATREVYGNCPQYIHPRDLEPERVDAMDGGPPVRTSGLDADQQALIESSDTFFIASAHPAGADASHRGGVRGFVTVAAPNRLWFPDYRGNNMFNTLGNLQTDPRAGLLFVDFTSGRTLQVSGRATLSWDDPRIAATAGAQRIIEVKIERVVDHPMAMRISTS